MVEFVLRETPCADGVVVQSAFESIPELVFCEDIVKGFKKTSVFCFYEDIHGLNAFPLPSDGLLNAYACGVSYLLSSQCLPTNSAVH
ncbi:unnamed protein product [Oppiella nova]|uniref:Uncharacterized protein n=1 Tax=Oppiella nova TaxID=334625 RepID=A0A7R9MFW1_9ACAR|nr:unnamed protein product [Oppiella nova]CAG2176325.1 unnamed protein product [Oppiella nova]